MSSLAVFDLKLRYG